MLNAVLQRLIQVLLLRAGPQDLPTSQSLLQVAAGIFLAISALRLSIVAEIGPALGQSVLGLGALWLFVHQLLRWRGTPERLTQTLTALLLCGSALGALLLLPLKALTPVLQAITENPGVNPQTLQVPALAMYAWLGISLWSLAVAGHIYRHALGFGFGAGIAVALLFEILLVAVVGSLGGVF